MNTAIKMNNVAAESAIPFCGDIRAPEKRSGQSNQYIIINQSAHQAIIKENL
ncbi:MAG: hypothetical protein J6575_05520 [Bifidobacterium sp.]|nr:hypothetical protein [Bifidobacterium sp.]